MTYKFMEKRSEKDRVRARVSSIYIVFYFRYEKRGIRRGFIPSCMAGLCMVQWRLTGYVPIALCRTVRKLMPSDSVTNKKTDSCLNNSHTISIYNMYTSNKTACIQAVKYVFSIKLSKAIDKLSY